MNQRMSRPAEPSTRRLQPSHRTRRTAGLLEELSERLRDGKAGELYVLCAKLESLRHRLAELPAAERRRLDQAASFLRRPIVALLDRAARGELVDPDARRDLRTILRSLRCIADQLDDPELGPRLRVRYAKVDIARLVHGCCAAFAKIAEERKLAFVVDVPDELSAELDPDKLEAVTANLLYNAFKHTPPLGQIRCSVYMDPGGDELVLAVADTGPSLPPHRAETIFDRSRYLDRVAPGLHALGLHLAISRDLVVLHGGTLTVRNNDEAGVAFELRMPRRAPLGTQIAKTAILVDDLSARVVELARAELHAEAELGSETAEPIADGRPLILIVEDTRSLHRLLHDCFKREYRVASAFDGLEGLAKAEALRPDLILTDLIMPRVDGRSMIRAMRRRPVLDNTPIVVLTTKDNADEELELLARDVQDVIHKPFLLPEVAARVRNLIESKRVRDVLSELVDRQETDLVHLADTVAQQQRELQAALEQVQAARALAESASKVKSNFLRMMSHELKTPLTAMQLQLGILERDVEFDRSPKLRDGHARIWRASRRLLHLIETMLEWARVESGRCRVYPERFDVVAAVQEVVTELSGQAQQKRVLVEVLASDDLEPELISDRRLVNIVLLNLLGRALQLTPSGKIEIDVKQRGTERIVSIKDAAPDRFMEEGDPFEPTHPTGSGAGLGLHVVRDIARAIGAEVAFENPAAPGHVIVLALPSLEPDSAMLPSSSGRASRPAPPPH